MPRIPPSHHRVRRASRRPPWRMLAGLAAVGGVSLITLRSFEHSLRAAFDGRSAPAVAMAYPENERIVWCRYRRGPRTPPCTSTHPHDPESICINFTMLGGGTVPDARIAISDDPCTRPDLGQAEVIRNRDMAREADFSAAIVDALTSRRVATSCNGKSSDTYLVLDPIDRGCSEEMAEVRSTLAQHGFRPRHRAAEASYRLLALTLHRALQSEEFTALGKLALDYL